VESTKEMKEDYGLMVTGLTGREDGSELEEDD